jgi:hypothetical protein
MTENELHELLQLNYFDNIDSGNASAAVLAFPVDAQWQHTQVWAHDGHDSRHTDRLDGRATLLAFLSARVPQMQVIQIKHRVDEVILSGDRGAFRGCVLGPDGRTLGFIGWVTLRDDHLQSYTIVPEDFMA